MLEMNLLEGEPWNFRTNAGEVIQARIHPVQIVLAGIDTPFNLPLAFAMTDIHRNLLGRDFLNLIQIGFRESQVQFFLEPTP